MKYYILAQSQPHMNLRAVLKSIKESGFDGVFFNLEYDKITLNDIKFCEMLNLDIEALHLPYGCSTDKVNRLWMGNSECDQLISEYKKYIDFAADNNINTVVMHCTNGYSPPRPNKKGLDKFRELAYYCKSKGIVMAFENNKSMDHLVYILENIDIPEVRLCFDIGHANVFTKNLDISVWDKLLSKLHCMHLHDNDGLSDQHLIPGFGCIDWSKWWPIIYDRMHNDHLTFELYYVGREKYYKNIAHAKFYETTMSKIKEVISSNEK